MNSTCETTMRAHTEAVWVPQQLWVQEAVDFMVKSAERDGSGRRRASCPSAMPTATRTARCPCSRCAVHPALPCASGSSPGLGDRGAGKFQHLLARGMLHYSDKGQKPKIGRMRGVRGSSGETGPQLDGCVATCVDDHMNLIPTMATRCRRSKSH